MARARRPPEPDEAPEPTPAEQRRELLAVLDYLRVDDEARAPVGALWAADEEAMQRLVELVPFALWQFDSAQLARADVLAWAAGVTDSPAGPSAEERTAVELAPGYYVDPVTGAWLTLPWPTNPDELPAGLAPGVIDWAHSMLFNQRTEHPWRFTRSQQRFLHQWYALRPDDRWRWRSGVKRGAKGGGKSPFAAAIALCELAGPVVFDGRDDQGRARGRAHGMALVQVGANSEDQAKVLVRIANGMVTRALADAVGLDRGIRALMTASGSRLEVLTRAEGSNEGHPATALLLEESHWMTATSGGQALAGVGRRNVAKSPGGHARALEFTNAHLPGGGSVAEDSFDAWQQQQAAVDTTTADILYDSREAPPHLRMHVPDELVQGIRAAYYDAPWVPVERIADEARDQRVPVADSVRYYHNQLPTNETAWVDPRAWDDLARSNVVVVDNEPLALFLDCSKSGDSTALVGCRIKDGYVVTLGCWQPPHGAKRGEWRVPREDVDAVVREQFHMFDVQWLGVDPSPSRDDDTDGLYWSELIDAWHRDFRDQVLVWATPNRSAVSFDMAMGRGGGLERNRAFTEMAALTAQEVDERRASALTHDGHPLLRRHVHNARRRPNEWGVTLSKATRDSGQLVDLAVSMVGARLGRRLVLNSGKERVRRGNGRVW